MNTLCFTKMRCLFLLLKDRAEATPQPTYSRQAHLLPNTKLLWTDTYPLVNFALKATPLPRKLVYHLVPALYSLAKMRAPIAAAQQLHRLRTLGGKPFGYLSSCIPCGHAYNLLYTQAAAPQLSDFHSRYC